MGEHRRERERKKRLIDGQVNEYILNNNNIIIIYSIYYTLLK